MRYEEHYINLLEDDINKRHNKNIDINTVKNAMEYQHIATCRRVCEWLRNNFYHEETMCDSIAYKDESCDIDKMIEDFKKVMEI